MWLFEGFIKNSQSKCQCVCVYVCRMFQTACGGVNSASACLTQGCPDTSQMWHQYTREFTLCYLKAEADKEKGSEWCTYIFRRRNKTPLPSSFSNIHSFLLFLLLEWVGVFIGVDVSVVAVLSSPEVTEAHFNTVSVLRKESKCLSLSFMK